MPSEPPSGDGSRSDERAELPLASRKQLAPVLEYYRPHFERLRQFDAGEAEFLGAVRATACGQN